MKKIIILMFAIIFLNGCAITGFEKGLNYEKTTGYDFEYDGGSGSITVINKKNGKNVSIAFGKGSHCGFYGLVGPLIFPIIPIWENKECDNVVVLIGITKNTHVIYQNKTYQPSEISEMGYYTFPLQTKSITETAILVVEKQDREIFEIPFRYQHSFSFAFFPGR
jgi:hypothetical protein